MKLSELIEGARLQLLTKAEYRDCDITGCYIGDLLSWVMGRAEPGNVWITIMSNINIAAVASLTDCACVLLAEEVTPEQEVIDKADAQGIVLLRSSKTCYQLAVELHRLTGL